MSQPLAPRRRPTNHTTGQDRVPMAVDLTRMRRDIEMLPLIPEMLPLIPSIEFGASRSALHLVLQTIGGTQTFRSVQTPTKRLTLECPLGMDHQGSIRQIRLPRL